MAPRKYCFSHFIRGRRKTQAHFPKFTLKRGRQGEARNNSITLLPSPQTPGATALFFSFELVTI